MMSEKNKKKEGLLLDSVLDFWRDSCQNGRGKAIKIGTYRKPSFEKNSKTTLYSLLTRTIFKKKLSRVCVPNMQLLRYNEKDDVIIKSLKIIVKD